MTAIILLGAIAGLGLLLLMLVLDSGGSGGTPAAALADLDAARRRTRAQTSLTVDRRHAGEAQSMRKLGTSIRRELDVRGISLPTTVRADLSIVGRSMETHLGYTLLGLALGAIVPLFVVGLFATLFFPSLRGVGIGGAVLIGILLGGLLPTLNVASEARARRRDFRHVVGSFLDLVAMNLAGGRGVPEALQSASRISDGWAMVRIRDTLEMARLQGATPWSALGQLGDDMRVDELRDMAAALALVADDGAKVRDSLSARAASLRSRELAEIEGRAQARSQSMLVAQLLLAAGFLIFLTYPAIARVLGS
jgi:Flp pilus assembly protein TadB